MLLLRMRHRLLHVLHVLLRMLHRLLGMLHRLLRMLHVLLRMLHRLHRLMMHLGLLHLTLRRSGSVLHAGVHVGVHGVASAAVGGFGLVEGPKGGVKVQHVSSTHARVFRHL